jgi:hypothetical protein
MQHAVSHRASAKAAVRRAHSLRANHADAHVMRSVL